MAALVLRRQVMLSGILGNVRQVHLAFQYLLTQLAVPAGQRVALTPAGRL